MLDARRAAVLKAIVEEYIATAQPVGSATVIRRAPIGVSSATVRNDMAYLESLGYIHQPHTSAGRVPSDLGYRYFVDNFARSNTLPAGDRSLISRFFVSIKSELEALLDRTSHLLSTLTQSAAVVVAPQLEDSTLLSIHLAQLDSRRILVVLVTRTGRVAKVLIDVDDDKELAADRLAMANDVLRDLLVGTSDWLAPHDAPRLDDPDVAMVVRHVLEAVGRAQDDSGEVYLGGASSLAERFEEIEVVANILQTLEERHRLVELLHSLITNADGGMVVRIGSEMPAHELQATSMVLAPYRFGGATGALGIVGPTRMDYSRAMSTVAYMSELLEHTLRN